ncbi:MAG: dihydrolipoamide acetyltransferase family protein [Dehalococcoidia bacterium]|nr:dihydrolipoamide acetyltransferase family protein [Dehalococcoidia bacterium]
MATSIVMPQMGYDMREGTVVRWHKKEGDPVARGEVIADIETDKATVEFEAFIGGVLRKIVAQEGVAVPVGNLIAVITGPDEALPEGLLTGAGPEAKTPQPPSAARDQGGIAAPSGPAALAGEVRASPIARRLARERGVDLSLVTGTGPGGRIVEDDVLAYQETPPAAEAQTGTPVVERMDLSRMRQVIAKVTVDSKREAPHFYLAADMDMTKAMEMRRDLNAALATEKRVSVNDLIVKACAVALQRHPRLNASFKGDHLLISSSINIGIAIALDAGLIVPGIAGCESKGLLEIAVASGDLIARANRGTLRNEEYSSTTFSISNLGMFDVDSFAAIIYPPHAAILAVGAVKERPVVRSGKFAVAKIMKSTLSVDHRVADGVEAARFLMEIKKLLENPVSLMLAEGDR